MKIPDLLEIALAWHHARNPTPEQRELAEYRLSVCDGCEHKHFKTLTQMYVCKACGCPLNKKVYSPKPGMEACPKQRWDR